MPMLRAQACTPTALSAQARLTSIGIMPPEQASRYTDACSTSVAPINLPPDMRVLEQCAYTGCFSISATVATRTAGRMAEAAPVEPYPTPPTSQPLLLPHR